MLILKFLAGVALVVLVAIVLARLVWGTPERGGPVASAALPPATAGPLAGRIAPLAATRPGRTGVVDLAEGRAAFAARMLLADAAVSAIDAQYYIWHDDLTGVLLLDALRRAAERGVRVRLLLDDNGVAGLDPELAQLDAHPNAEVRLWNPFVLRTLKPLNYVFDFFRLNRRMHNKSFTVDGVATVVGGRNIGDEYFDWGVSALYVDLDVLAVGEAVGEVAEDFGRYWMAKATYDLESVVPPHATGDPIAAAVARVRNDPDASEYDEALRASSAVQSLLAGDLAFEWADAILVSDDPVKGLGRAKRDDLLAARIASVIGSPDGRLDGVSPYFVPAERGTELFTELAERGVAVRMLTNSQVATDVIAVHAGYTKRRDDLLRSGVELFELKRAAAPPTDRSDMGPFGSSGASLHAKTFAVDGKRIYVGSFNFDPRSTMLNTEMGLVIDSDALAGRLHEIMDDRIADFAYRVELCDGGPVWIERVDGHEVVHRTEPGTTWFGRAAVTAIGWLPIEWLL